MPTASPVVDGELDRRADELPAPDGRLVAVGVRDTGHDAATLAWAVAEARAGVDALHVVHAYLPVRLEGCAWEPVSRARDHRHGEAGRIVAQGVQQACAAAGGLRVEGSAVAGLPEDVLGEMSSIVDLLVIGDDSAADTRTRAISWHVQDIARCPVVCVPEGHVPGDRRDR